MKKILILPGDGIGPEVVAQVMRVIDWFSRKGPIKFDIQEDLIGGCAYEIYGVPLSDQTVHRAMISDAVLLGAVGGPRWDRLPFDKKPEQGLLRLRKSMGLFANLRPTIVFNALVDASTLKPEIIRGLDIIIVRELAGGIYFGEPRGIKCLPDGTRYGLNTHIYTDREIERIARVAFDISIKRNRQVCSVDKANVMEAGVLWREKLTELWESEYRVKGVNLVHMYADNCAMQLVRAPKQFDVIVTDNLFGDLLSDCSAMLAGSLGMLPSASLGETMANGYCQALYEPVHGSAPEIAGRNIANPIAALLSFAMMLRYSFNQERDATLLERAVQQVLDGDSRTADIMQPYKTEVSTAVMGDMILRELAKLAA